jgi:WD40 repeat protein
MPEPEARNSAAPEHDLRPLLDQELSRLGDKYRVALVLCDLEGRTRRDVAQQLGIPLGTLSGQLTTARRLLARRLARRGLVISAGALTAALSPRAASAGVSAPLVARVVQSATALAAGQAATAVVAAPVAALAEGVLKAMWIEKLKLTTALLVMAAILVGAVLLAQHPSVGRPLAILAGGENLPANGMMFGEPRVLELGDRGRRLAWSPDGKTLAVATIVESLFRRKSSAVRLWDVDAGQVRQTLAESPGGGLAFQSVAFSPDGKSIAGTVTEEVVRPGSREIRDVIKLWDARTLALQRRFEGESQLVCVAFSPDGRQVAGANPSQKTIGVWNVGTGTRARRLSTGEAQPWSVAFAPDDKTLVVGGQLTGGSGQIQVWDARAWKLKHVWKQAFYVNRVAFSLDGKMIAACGGGELVEVWSVEKADRLLSVKGNRRGQRTLAFSPDGRTVAAGAPDGKIRLWDVRTGTLQQTLEGHDDEVHAIAFSPDGKTLASTSQDQTVRLWPLVRRGAKAR